MKWLNLVLSQVGAEMLQKIRENLGIKSDEHVIFSGISTLRKIVELKTEGKGSKRIKWPDGTIVEIKVKNGNNSRNSS